MSDPNTPEGIAPGAHPGAGQAMNRTAQACLVALTGHDATQLGDPGLALVHNPAQLVQGLEQAGWGTDALSTTRKRCHHEGKRWPMVVPGEYLVQVGFAQLHAWVRECLVLVNLDAVYGGVRDSSQTLDAEDRRLMADRPPHHGSVG